MGITDRLNAWVTAKPARSNPVISIDDYLQLVSMGGNVYLTGALQQTLSGKSEDIPGDFAGLVQQAYKANGIVFAVMLARMQLFTEARFQFQRFRDGRPAELYGGSALGILEHPWPNGVTGDLLARAIQDADLAGNFFATRRGGAIRRMRPDWVTIVLGSENDPNVEAGDIDAEVLGYIYHPGGKTDSRPPEVLLRNEVCHFAPIPDPVASFRGMSWLTPVLREINADKSMTEHKIQYLQNGATPNMVVSLDKDAAAARTPEAFAEWIEAFKKLNPTGAWDKFKTMYLAGGTTMEVVGGQLGSAGVDIKQVQGAGETRIAAAGGVPPVIVGLSEGLQAATYSNYGQARRRFADGTMRPLWRNFAGSLETIVPAPANSRLWYDDRDIQALAEDKKDLAEVRTFESQQIRTLTDAGFTPDSVIEAVTNGDMGRLKGNHTGLFSVQLQPPMPDGPAKPEPPAPPPPARASDVHFHEGAFSITNTPAAVNVERTEVNINEGAVRVDNPVTVERTEVNISEGAVRLDAPITVEPPSLTIEPGAFPINVERSDVHIDEGAVHIDAPVTVEKTEVTVERTEITVEQPDITVSVPDRKPVTRTVVRDAKDRIVAVTEED